MKGLNYSKSNLNPVNLSHIECLKSSKRIVLLLTEKFMNNIWINQNFRANLRDLCEKDPDCVIIIVTIHSIEVIKPAIKLFESEIENELNISYWRKIKGCIHHNFGINQIESLKWNSLKFWQHLLYLMPMLEGKCHKNISNIVNLNQLIHNLRSSEIFNKTKSIFKKKNYFPAIDHHRFYVQQPFIQ